MNVKIPQNSLGISGWLVISRMCNKCSEQEILPRVRGWTGFQIECLILYSWTQSLLHLEIFYNTIIDIFIRQLVWLCTSCFLTGCLDVNTFLNTISVFAIHFTALTPEFPLCGKNKRLLSHPTSFVDKAAFCSSSGWFTNKKRASIWWRRQQDKLKSSIKK